MYAATRGPNVKRGGTDFKWGAGHHWPPAGDDPDCDAYMDVQKERKATLFTVLEHREKKLAAYLLHNIDIAVVSECLCHLKAQYFVLQSPSICIG